MAETRARSIAKAVSWRATGTLDTFVLGWLITGHAGTAGTIAATEVATKVALYYLHERAWAYVRRHRVGPDSHARSVAKAISWRATGTLDTFLISWLITGHLGQAGGIAATEVMTKLALYYLHERGWARIGWGLAQAAPAPVTSAQAAPVQGEAPEGPTMALAGAPR
jgi:uncharacterized membrane protein